MSGTPPVAAIAVRLADEGVPLRAIARSLHTPSDEVRTSLRNAQLSGQLVALPKEDWPPGFPRDQRALQLSRMVVEDKVAVVLAMQQLFRLTGTEGNLLMLLLQNSSVPKARINLVRRTVDVHVHNVRRRLAPFGIAIVTLWGYGYQLSADSRQRVMEMILAHVKGAPHDPV